MSTVRGWGKKLWRHIPVDAKVTTGMSMPRPGAVPTSFSLSFQKEGLEELWLDVTLDVAEARSVFETLKDFLERQSMKKGGA